MSGVYFGAMVPKTPNNKNQISQKKALLKELLKPTGLFSNLM